MTMTKSEKIAALERENAALLPRVNKANSGESREDGWLLDQQIQMNAREIARLKLPDPKPKPDTSGEDDAPTEDTRPEPELIGQKAIDAEVKNFRRLGVFNPLRKISVGLKRMTV